jgi:hypothetical protein
VVIADLNADGDADLTVANGTLESDSVLMGIGGAVVGVPGNERRLARLQLGPARPTPFTSTTSIPFDLATSCRVKAEIFDIRGRHIATLIDASLPAGHHAVAWTGRDDHGNVVAAAIYVARLVTPGGTVARTIVRVR